jgi:hypothetical protein
VAGKRGSAPPIASEAHCEGVLAGYRIATYQPRSREAWRAALEAAGLEGEARAAAAAYLEDRWKAQPYDPTDFAPRPRYGEGAPIKMVFCTKQGRGA